MIARGGRRRKHPREHSEDADREGRRPAVKDKRHRNWKDYLEDVEEEDLENTSDERDLPEPETSEEEEEEESS